MLNLFLLIICSLFFMLVLISYRGIKKNDEDLLLLLHVNVCMRLNRWRPLSPRLLEHEYSGPPKYFARVTRRLRRKNYIDNRNMLTMKGYLHIKKLFQESNLSIKNLPPYPNLLLSQKENKSV